VLITHRLEELDLIADAVTVLRDGRHVATRPASELSRAEIVRMMVGRPVETLFAERKAKAPGREVLRVDGLGLEGEFSNVSFSLHAGEIVGMAGLVGAGRTEVAECLYGARPIASGEILLDGRAVTPRSPYEALDLGIGYATEDRKSAGIFHMLSVALNIEIGALVRPGVSRQFVHAWSWLKRGDLRALSSGLVRQLQVRPANLNTPAGSLSGGNQQKLVFGRLIAGKLRVLILDEPTRGVDVGAKAQIWQLVRQLADSGMAILAISSDIPELIGNVDRLLIMRRGRIVTEIAGGDVSEDRVMRHMV
jgi:rhamnose transport system ATP-binding protein